MTMELDKEKDMRQAFLTGGSGYLGRNLIRELVKQDWYVKALARSDEAARVVKEAGADPIRGDLNDSAAMRAGMQDCEVVFHSAAQVGIWDKHKIAYQVNVVGTENTLKAAQQAGVQKFVHVSTEAVLVDKRTTSLKNVDETVPRATNPLGFYPRTKGLAEEVVLQYNTPEMPTVIMRPRFIWGRDDTTLLPEFIDRTKSGLLRWFNGGNYRFSTCHVANACEGLILGAEKGRGGEIYFLTDGEPVIFREFISDMLRTQNVKPPKQSVPLGLMVGVAAVSEFLWNTFPLPGDPPATRMALKLVGIEVTLDDRKARRELGYQANVSIADGLAELRARYQSGQ